MKPQRIQLKRTKGWRMPPNTVKVDRTTKWGNDWVVGVHGTAQECVAAFAHCLSVNIWSHPNRKEVQDELRGKNLACWCKPGQPCHADVLLAVANGWKVKI